jgi:type IV secretory pathway VirB2 component (pilin)
MAENQANTKQPAIRKWLRQGAMLAGFAGHALLGLDPAELSRSEGSPAVLSALAEATRSPFGGALVLVSVAAACVAVGVGISTHGQRNKAVLALVLMWAAFATSLAWSGRDAERGLRDLLIATGGVAAIDSTILWLAWLGYRARGARVATHEPRP